MGGEDVSEFLHLQYELELGVLRPKQPLKSQQNTRGSGQGGRITRLESVIEEGGEEQRQEC